jgi:hypothetical protein
MQAHRDEHVGDYLDSVSECFGVIAEAARGGVLRERLRGPVAHPASRLT